MFHIDSNNSIAYVQDMDSTLGGYLFESFAEFEELANKINWSKAEVTAIWNGFAGVAGPFADLKPCKCFRNRPYGLGRIWWAIQRLVPSDVPLEPATLAARAEANRDIEHNQKKRRASVDCVPQVTCSEPVADTVEDCQDCDATGQLCSECGDVYGQCDCEDSTINYCAKCEGSGHISTTAAQEKEKDPMPKKAKRQKKAPKAKKAVVTEVAARKTKRDDVVKLISREKGASIQEIMDKMCWLPHSVRGFVSTLKSKHGINIVSEKSEKRGLVYKIAA